MRTAKPLPYPMPASGDGEFVVTLREFSSHRKVIVRDDGDGSILWQSNWSAANAVEDAGGMWAVTFAIPRTRLTQARTAKLAGRAIIIELWLRHPWTDAEAGTSGNVEVLEFGLDIKL
jgi:hypothetical protein